MVDPIFEEALTGLGKKQDSKTVLKILVHIRGKVEWPKNVENIEKLREKGCLKYLVGILQMPQKHILDVCLSILGNCIMDKSCARETIGTYNILSPLNHLLRRYPKEDSINGRIFRILGNMCQHRDKWAIIILDRKPHIVMHIVSFLKNYYKDDVPAEEKYSEASAIMAIRTLRLLLNSQTVTPLVKSYGVLKTVGSILIKLSSEWQENKSNEGVLNNIIRLLYDYSRYQYYHSILEMRNTDRGDSLVHLCNVLLLSPKKIVKIIMNFIKISQLNSELPVPEICDKFIEEVMKKNYDTEEFKRECIEYIQCLCYLLEHPATRNTERCANCLPLLIKVLDSFDKGTNIEIECSILLVKTMNNFKYDEGLIQEQLKCNVIRVVLSKLRWVVGDPDTLHFGHKRVGKRKGSQIIFRNLLFADDSFDTEFSFYEPVVRRPQSPYSPPLSDDESAIFALRTFDRSPSPCSSVASNDAPSTSWSPRSSPLPFGGAGPGVASDSDSDDYSPVCSEAGDEEEEQEEVGEGEGEGGGVAMIEEGEFAEAEEESADEENSPIEASSTKSLKAKLIIEISKLIATYSRIQPPLPDLGQKDLLLALIKCALYPSLPSSVPTTNAISRILRSQVYLIPLMKTTFVEKVYCMTTPRHSACARCAVVAALGRHVLRRLTDLAESEVGKGEIAHALLRGNGDDRRMLALAVPYIVTNKPILAKLLLNCGGLEVLIDLLKEDDVSKDRIIRVLCALASKRLEIANPSAAALEADAAASRPTSAPDPDDAVHFLLDDGSRVCADRSLLVAQSEFFRALLDGHFMEGGLREVRLRLVDGDSMRCLLQLMGSTDRVYRTVRHLDLTAALELIALADRFLLPRLVGRLAGCVRRHRLSPRTASAIYRWAVESRLGVLRADAVACALAAPLDDAGRRRLFGGLVALGGGRLVAEDVGRLLGGCLARYAR